MNPSSPSPPPPSSSSSRVARSRLPRRALLLGTLAAAGCGVTVRLPGESSPTSHPAASATASSPRVDALPSVPEPSVTPTPSASLGPHLPTRPEIIAAFGARSPRQWGMAVEGVVSRSRGPLTALTFDACGGGAGAGYDAQLIATLRRLAVPATLFFNARWIKANPSVAQELATDPLFEIASHGVAHVPLSVTGRKAYGIRGTRDAGAVYDEVEGTHEWFAQVARAPSAWFRPGTAHCDDVGAAIARALRQPVVGFSVNGDGGATFSAAQVEGALAQVGPGDVVISHMNHPRSGTHAGYAAALPRLLGRGIRFGTVSQSLA